MTNLSGLTLGTSPGAVTLAPGVYCFASSAQLTGTLTLSGNGVYIFQIGSTFTSASGASVLMVNGAVARMCFGRSAPPLPLAPVPPLWVLHCRRQRHRNRPGPSSLGRVFALSGAVTLDTNTIVSPVNQQFIIESTGDHRALDLRPETIRTPPKYARSMPPAPNNSTSPSIR